MDEMLARLRLTLTINCNGVKDGWCESHESCRDCYGDQIDALEAELASGWMKLPVDADGAPCHVGDVMEWPNGETFEVVAIGDGTLFYLDGDCATELSADWTGASTKRHHGSDSWERIIEDAMGDRTQDPAELVARCEALAKEPA